MTSRELLDRLKSKALQQLALDQDERARGKCRNVHPDELIEACRAEVRAAATIGDLIHVMIKRHEASAFTYNDDAPTWRRLPQSVEHERVYLFLLQALGVENVTLADVHLRSV